MYRYDEFDRKFVAERASQFRDQVARRLDGSLTEDEFRPLRLMNGLYLQLHAYMLRIAIPYGVISAHQLRRLAYVARRYDRGFGHVTTRQNVQLNFIKLVDAPDILDALAEVDMHAMQTSGNCIRNVTADPYGGIAHDEIDDPRITAEILRQWSTLHPEFSFLPRKFKIAVTAALEDRTALAFHDIGLRLVRRANEGKGYQVFVGGGQGRTPVIAEKLSDFVPERHLLSYLEAVLRVYNLHGRRDNIYKARIKILVSAIGIEKFREEVEAEWPMIRDSAFDLPPEDIEAIRSRFRLPPVKPAPLTDAPLAARRRSDPDFDRWYRQNVRPHKVAGHVNLTVTLKSPDRPPGDISAAEMDAVAGLSERFANGEIRATYQQNLILPHIRLADVIEVYDELLALGLASIGSELIGDIIACPGLDYCNLANARSIPVAQAIAERFKDPARQADIGPLRLNISGCINACGHHHAGHIGILGVDKKGTEHYQITLGGSPSDAAAIGEIVGPSFPAEDVPGAIETIIETYLGRRQPGETFLSTLARTGANPFKEALYGAH